MDWRRDSSFSCTNLKGILLEEPSHYGLEYFTGYYYASVFMHVAYTVVFE